MRICILGVVFGALSLVGCSTSMPDPLGAGGPSGPGRFKHSAIQRSIAPWDGPATQLYLAEQPVTEKGETPHVSVYICQAPAELSGQRVRLSGDDIKQGNVSWVPAAGKGVLLDRVEIQFDEVKEGRPVTGTYDLDMPDGTRERGRFTANWLPALGPGG
jgi:hypothetical protein